MAGTGGNHPAYTGSLVVRSNDAGNTDHAFIIPSAGAGSEHVPVDCGDHAPDGDEYICPQEREPERHDAEQRPALKSLHARRNKEVLREKERHEPEYEKYEVLLVLTCHERRENKARVHNGEKNIAPYQRDERDHDCDRKRVRHDVAAPEYL